MKSIFIVQQIQQQKKRVTLLLLESGDVSKADIGYNRNNGRVASSSIRII